MVSFWSSVFWASIFVFGLLIFFHELGHFTIAKLVGIKVHEFSLGFGPKIAGFLRGETRYNIRLFPLGGFVRMAGMDPEEEDFESEKRGFNKKSVLQRISVILAGPLMNFVLAALLLAVIFLFQGVPVFAPKVDGLVPGQPAERAGIAMGDKILAIDGKKIESWEELKRKIDNSPGKKVNLLIQRDGKELNITVVPAPQKDGLGKIGIYPGHELKKVGPVGALAAGASKTVEFSVLIIDFIGRMITGQERPDLGGPVRVVWEISKAVELGFIPLLTLAALLSINLGLFNLFPIPALDGSRILFLIIERFRGRPVDPRKENYIHMVGFGLLLMLIVVITYNDILQLL
ncbi:MAG: peptidase [Peptococcaceae bacterium BRH_c4b]|nr:MAG: peptidase [Peptococcaceae bacterium BRH_c4b]